jgi:GNAT superfamily N-acetyltransferase
VGCAIRLATAEDGPRISALVVSLARYLLEDPDDTGSAAPFFETVSADAIGGAISGGRFIYHLAEAGGGLVGAVGVRDGCHVCHLLVAEGWQGRGVGGALWRVARGWAEGRGAVERFTVNASVGAVPVYARLGFVVAGEVARVHGVVFVPMVLECAAVPRG